MRNRHGKNANGQNEFVYALDLLCNKLNLYAVRSGVVHGSREEYPFIITHLPKNVNYNNSKLH
jgi:hypothetical protein